MKTQNFNHMQNRVFCTIWDNAYSFIYLKVENEIKNLVWNRIRFPINITVKTEMLDSIRTKTKNENSEF